MSDQSPPRIFSLPLFPLHFVLFPEFPLQLHVFEERYKAMIGECVERNQPFGVVLIAEGRETGPPPVPHSIGCIARILAVKKLDDGRMNLLAVGQGRFRLLEYSEAELPYLVGRVESVDDDPTAIPETERSLQDLHRLFNRYMKLLAQCSGLTLPDVTLPEDPTTLGFCIAAFTQAPSTEKQRLLAMTDSAARLKAERRLLRKQIKELEAIKSQPAEEQTESEVKVLYAEPLDSTTETWQAYLHEARN